MYRHEHAVVLGLDEGAATSLAYHLTALHEGAVGLSHHLTRHATALDDLVLGRELHARLQDPPAYRIGYADAKLLIERNGRRTIYDDVIEIHAVPLLLQNPTSRNASYSQPALCGHLVSGTAITHVRAMHITMEMMFHTLPRGPCRRYAPCRFRSRSSRSRAGAVRNPYGKEG